MKTLLGTYSIFVFIFYVISFFAVSTPASLGDLRGLGIVPLILALIVLVISFLVDIRKNKGVQKRNRYFKKLLHINLGTVPLAFLVFYVTSDKNILFGDIYPMAISFLFIIPAIGYIVGRIADSFKKQEFIVNKSNY